MVFNHQKNMVMSWTTVLSVCFLIGTISTAPAPAPSSPRHFKKSLELLYHRLQKECTATKFGECWDHEITEVKFHVNCTRAIYENMFCQADKALRNFNCTSYGRVVPNITIPSDLQGNQANCSPRNTSLALKEFCSLLNSTIDELFREC
ncbi:uncharacterized protein LOC144586838 [Pogona vitticeps]